MEKYDIEKDFAKLIENGWLTESEADLYAGNPDILEVISVSESPTKENIFNALKHLKVGDVKVVILGKDPYPNPLDAHGYAFSSNNKTTPDSLKNIFKAIDEAYGSNLFQNARNNLLKWADSGVLLLNTSLTFQKISNPDKKLQNTLQEKAQNRHKRIWKPFVKTIIQKLLSKKSKTVMLLWGNDAHELIFANIKDNGFKQYLHDRNPVIIPNTQIMLLQTSHPSPLSVNRGGDFPQTAVMHFKECDKFLGAEKVVWSEL